MAFFVAQHGISLPRQEDPNKGLSPQGRLDVERIAQVAADYGVRVAEIWHSGKKRAEQTARIFGTYLKPSAGVQAIEGLKPMDDVMLFAHRIDMAQNRMIVGHLPFLEGLVAQLVSNQSVQPVIRLQNGGLVCLDFYPGSENIVIKWAINPIIP